MEKEKEDKLIDGNNLCCLGYRIYTPIFFKMAVIPLVPETKMVDVGKRISLGNLLVRKVT